MTANLIRPDRRTTRAWGTLALVACAAGLTACEPESLVKVRPPGTLVDVSSVETPTGAAQLYSFAVTKYSAMLTGFLNNTWDSHIPMSGIIADELMVAACNGSCNFDQRTFTAPSGNYNNYHVTRQAASQAREALSTYAPAAPAALRGRLYATEGATIVLLAELFCSGIPLTRVTLSGEATPTAGYTTEQLYRYALALFDTAISISTDTARFVYFAKVMKGRALLGVGDVAAAGDAVRDVPLDFIYNTEHDATSLGGRNINIVGSAPRGVFVQDREGGNGLVWSTDPRTAVVTTPSLSSAMPYSAKYNRTNTGTLDPTQTSLNNSVRAADGLEARLIEAEANLAAGGTTWLTTLNMLRATCVGTAPCAPVPGLTAAALPPLTDPGSADARLDMLMRERAMWLFLTGHRFGDLRRLSHVYHRDPLTLWPTGTYLNPGFLPLIAAASSNGQAYGSSIVIQTNPASEQGNPLYTGCYNYAL